MPPKDYLEIADPSIIHEEAYMPSDLENIDTAFFDYI